MATSVGNQSEDSNQPDMILKKEKKKEGCHLQASVGCRANHCTEKCSVALNWSAVKGRLTTHWILWPHSGLVQDVTNTATARVTTWLHSRSYLRTFQHWLLTKIRNQLRNCCVFFIPFLWVGPLVFVHFISPLKPQVLCISATNISTLKPQVYCINTTYNSPLKPQVYCINTTYNSPLKPQVYCINTTFSSPLKPQVYCINNTFSSPLKPRVYHINTTYISNLKPQVNCINTTYSSTLNPWVYCTNTTYCSPLNPRYTYQYYLQFPFKPTWILCWYYHSPHTHPPEAAPQILTVINKTLYGTTVKQQSGTVPAWLGLPVLSVLAAMCWLAAKQKADRWLLSAALSHSLGSYGSQVPTTLWWWLVTMHTASEKTHHLTMTYWHKSVLVLVAGNTY